MRVTNQTHLNNLLRDLQANDLALLEIQRALSSGRRVNRPSDDPIAAASAVGYEQALEKMDAFARNTEAASSYLKAANTVFDTLQEALRNARSVALAQSSDTASAQTRRAQAQFIDSVITDVIQAANTRFKGRYLFAGTTTGRAPFERDGGGVIYRGDDGTVPIRVSAATSVESSVAGTELLGVMATRAGGTDLDPVLYLGENGGDATLLSALNRGTGILSGRFEIRYSGGTATVDLAGASDLADVKERIEAATGGTVLVEYRPDRKGLRLRETTGGFIQVSEVAGGRTAASLGIAGSGSAGILDGEDLDPAMTVFTRLQDLNGGAGVDTSGFTLSHAGETVSVTPSELSGTVGDLLSALKRKSSRTAARLTPDGTGIEIFARVSGQALTIAENGGASAAQLGLAPGSYEEDDTLKTLLDLKQALLSNDRDGIMDAIPRLDKALERLLDLQGAVGARISRLETASKRLEEQTLTVKELMSDLVDANVAEMAVRFSERKTALEAALKAAAGMLPLSLVDFL